MNRMSASMLTILCSWIVIVGVVQAACNAGITATAPDNRYTDNADGTITDRVTGLMWKQCSEGQSTSASACDTSPTPVSSITFTWQGALQQAEAFNNAGGLAGYTDWRLPNRNELASLVERQCYSRSINENFFPAAFTLPGYWSSSANAGNPNVAWAVDFENGFVGSNAKTSAYFVRFVRGGR